MQKPLLKKSPIPRTRPLSWLTSGKLISVSAALAAVAGLNAGTFTTDFSKDPGGTALANRSDNPGLIRDSTLELVNLADLIDPSTGVFDDRRKPLRGSYVFPEIDAGKRIAGFTVSFKARVGGGTESPADGFSLVLANDYDSSSPFREAGGSTTGLTISFKTINGTGADSEPNDPSDPPGIIVKQKGQKVIAKPFSGLATDPAGDVHPPVFVPVVVTLTTDGLLTVNYNTNLVYNKVPIGYLPINGSFGFGAGTEGQASTIDANFWIKNVSITTTNVSGPYVTSVDPGTQDVTPDAAVRIVVQDLGSTSATMTFDGNAVTPVKSDAGGGATAFSYAPTSLFDPGSSHTLKLTFGSSSFSYGFKVANAPVIAATAAAPAGAVDTSKSGFRVRVYQTAETQPNSDSRRAENELAGQLGVNIADTTGAIAGYFTLPTINFGVDAGGGAIDQGSIPGDNAIPGIPGSDGTANNIAMEVLGYLDLAAGSYTLGAVSDDSLKVSIGGDPRDITSLTLIDLAIGTATAPFIIKQSGIYPIRALWTQGGGPAGLELWTQDASGKRTLLNTAGSVKAYAQAKSTFKALPYLSQASPGPGNFNVSTAPKVTLVLNDDATTVDASSIKLAIAGNSIVIPGASVTKTGNATTIAITSGINLAPNTLQAVHIEFKDSTGATITRDFSFTTGKATGGDLANSVKGYWNFKKGNLAASVGRDLRFVDDSIASRYKFGLSGAGNFASIAGINGKPANFIYVPYVTSDQTDASGPIYKRIGLRMAHDIAANGGGKKVNQYTIILDLMWGDGTGNGVVAQLHDLDNPGDGDLYWSRGNGSYGKSCCSAYVSPNAQHPPNTWARVVFAVDLAANPPVLAKYINGVKNLEAITGTRGHIDSEFALSLPEIVLFGDSDNETSDAYLSAVQVREGRMSDDDVAALGGPDASGIPLPYSQWNFEHPANPLVADVGNDLIYVDPSLAGKYKTGVTGKGDFAAIPLIGGQPSGVLLVPYLTSDQTDAKGPLYKRIGLRMPHGLVANGGGKKVNQYTLILDLLWGDGTGNGVIGQFHDLDNPGDGDLYWSRGNGSYGKSCCSAYVSPNAQHPANTWARVAFSVDLSANPPILAKYINGIKNLDAITGTRGHVDSEFALSLPEIVLFGDSDNETSDAYISSLQVRQGRMSDDAIAALGGPTASGIPTPNPVKGEWNFDDAAHPLAATVGADLQFVDPDLSGKYKTGVTGQGDFASIPKINGKPAGILFVPYLTSDQTDAKGPLYKRIGLKIDHGVSSNGGGKKVNQYTIVIDLLWGDGTGNGVLFQFHDLDNPGDGDLYWSRGNGSYGKSCCSAYVSPNAQHPPNTWARVVFGVDLSASPPILAKYINGIKNLDAITGTRGHVDSEFAMSVPEIIMFGDSDNETSDAYISALQIREGRMSDDDVAALGGPDADGIPSASIGAVAATSIPSVSLQSGDTLSGAFADDSAGTIDTAAKTVTIPIGKGTKFFRIKGTASIKSVVRRVNGTTSSIVITY